jgi:hypothetical protein
MRIIKRFESFISEEFVATQPQTTPTPTITPTITPTTTPMPTRPGAPSTIPSEEDAPLASTAQDVIDRLSRVYSDSSEKEKEEIDSYFEEK